MEFEETRELNPLFEERERRRKAESLPSLVEAELDDARAALRRARRLALTLAAFAATAFVATAFVVCALK